MRALVLITTVNPPPKTVNPINVEARRALLRRERSGRLRCWIRLSRSLRRSQALSEMVAVGPK